MKTIPVRLSKGHDHKICIGADLRKLGAALKPMGLSRSLMVVSAAPISRLYSKPLAAGLHAAGFAPSLSLMPNGEQFKNLKTMQSLYQSGVQARLDRKSAVVALGGGVVGDTAGFMAATFLRGVRLVQCPTTLLAMVDSSIGGKTGVDLPSGKNLVGAFWQPEIVWMDLSVLDTLPDREWRTGLAEVIKYGLIADPKILDLLSKTTLTALKKNKNLLQDIVRRSAGIKVKVVTADEKETSGTRALLNLGHTFGHAIETVSGYKSYTHGEAVSIGLCAAMRLGAKLKTFRSSDVERVERLLRQWGLPLRPMHKLPRKQILSAMSRDKKVLDGAFRFVIPVGLGKARVVKGVPQHVIDEVLSEVGL